MTDDETIADRTGASVVGVGVAACAACCAVPAFGFVSAILAGASVAALALSGILLAVLAATAGAGFIVWRRHLAQRSSLTAQGPTPVAFPARPGR